MELEIQTLLGLKVVAIGAPDQLGRLAVTPCLGTVRSVAHLLASSWHTWFDSCESAATVAACAKTQPAEETNMEP